MPKLTNTSRQPITASTGHTVPAGGDLTVSAQTWDRISREAYITTQMRLGHLTVSADAVEKAGGEITRTTIAKANRDELLDIIAAHSDYTEADLEGVYVEDRDGEDGLRTIAARLVFRD